MRNENKFTYKRYLAVLLSACMLTMNTGFVSPIYAGGTSEKEATASNAETDDVLPDGLVGDTGTSSDATLSDAVELSAVVDDCIITVSAPEGVFPEGCSIKASKVSEDTKIQEKIDSAVENEHEDNNIADSCTFDIKVLNKDKLEIEPDTRFGEASVKFEMSKAPVKFDDIAVYHVKEDAHDDQLNAEKMDTEVKKQEESVNDTVTAKVSTDSFSYYTVEFHYNDIVYVMPGDTTVKLSDIQKSIGITGTVSDATVSDASLLTAVKDDSDDDWTVTALQAFHTNESLNLVLLDGTKYSVLVTDSSGTITGHDDYYYVTDASGRRWRVYAKIGCGPETVSFDGYKDVYENVFSLNNSLDLWMKNYAWGEKDYGWWPAGSYNTSGESTDDPFFIENIKLAATFPGGSSSAGPMFQTRNDETSMRPVSLTQWNKVSNYWTLDAYLPYLKNAGSPVTYSLDNSYYSRKYDKDTHTTTYTNLWYNSLPVGAVISYKFRLKKLDGYSDISLGTLPSNYVGAVSDSGLDWFDGLNAYTKTTGDITTGNLYTASISGSNNKAGTKWTGTTTLPDAVSRNYQWQYSTDQNTWNDISGATSSTYTIGSDLVGDYIRMEVLGDGTNTTGSIMSNVTGPVYNNYTIHYDSNSGTMTGTVTGTMADQTAEYDVATTLDANTFTKNGYTFSGWTTTADGSGTYYNDQASVKNIAAGSSVTLYAKWTANPDTPYKIEHYIENVDDTDYSLKDTEQKTGTTDSYVTATSKTYTGFIYNESSTENVSSGNVNGDGTLVLKLYYARNKHTVTYSFSGIPADAKDLTPLPVPQTVKYEASVSLPDAPSATGYSFNSWTTPDASVSGNAFIMPDSDVSVIGKWNANRYQIAFDAVNNLSGDHIITGSMSNAEETYDQRSNLPENKYVMKELITYDYNYDGGPKTVSTVYNSFNGWKYNDTDYDDESEIINLTANDGDVLHFTAQWKAVQTDCPVPERTGYLFNGWSYSKDDTAGEISDSFTPEGSVTLYATWKPINYYAAFRGNGGTGSMDDESFTYDAEKALTANAFTKTGYTFSSWEGSDSVTYTDQQTVKNVLDFDRGLVTLNAVWIANRYTLMFDPTGSKTMNRTGTVSIPSESILYDHAVTYLPVPKMSGWKFEGWYTDKAETVDKNGKAVYDFDNFSGQVTKNTIWQIPSNTTLYAKWSVDSNGGNGGSGSNGNGGSGGGSSIITKKTTAASDSSNSAESSVQSSTAIENTSAAGNESSTDAAGTDANSNRSNGNNGGSGNSRSGSGISGRNGHGSSMTNPGASTGSSGINGTSAAAETLAASTEGRDSENARNRSDKASAGSEIGSSTENGNDTITENSNHNGNVVTRWFGSVVKSITDFMKSRPINAVIGGVGLFLLLIGLPFLIYFMFSRKKKEYALLNDGRVGKVVVKAKDKVKLTVYVNGKATETLSVPESDIKYISEKEFKKIAKN